MEKINWQADEKALAAGMPLNLTGGVVRIVNGKRVVKFTEKMPDGRGVCLIIETRPALAAEVARIEKAEADRQARMWEVHLSSRGWGDYSPVVWSGDITRPDAEILAECRSLLARGNDVDHPNQSDDELIGKIRAAKKDWAEAPAKKAAMAAEAAADRKHKIETGYCFRCGTWCYGDCGA